MAKNIFVECSYRKNKVIVTYDDGSVSAFDIVNGMIPIEVFVRLEVAIAHGCVVKVKYFV